MLQSLSYRVGLVLLGSWLGSGLIGLQGQEPLEPPTAVEPAVPEDAPPARDAEADVPLPDDGSHAGELVRVGGNVVVPQGERVSNVVVVMGEATVDGDVEHDVVVVMGRARVNGEVRGGVVAPMTDLELGPNARIHGDLMVVGGSLVADPAARVDGERVELTWEQLEQYPGVHWLRSFVEGLMEWVTKGLMMGRPLPHQWGWWWWVALGAAFVYFFTGLLMPAPVGATAKVVQEQPLVSFFIGIAGYALACLMFTLLSFTLVGLLLVPFLFCGTVAAQIVGKVSVYQCIGNQIGRQAGITALTRPLPGILGGLVLLTGTAMVPVLGFVVVCIAAPLGFGAALLAAVRGMRRDQQTAVIEAPPSLGRAALPGPETVMAGPLLGVAPPVLGSETAGLQLPGDMESLPRAGFWIRFAATLLDLILVLVAAALLGVEDYFLLPWIVYHVGLWSWRGTTVGGTIFGLRLVRRDGSPLTFPVALVRALAAFLSFVALFLGFFWVGWSRQRVSWHDLIAGTLIVRLPRGMPLI